MSVSIVIISHHKVGHAMLDAAKSMYEKGTPLPISTIEVKLDADPEKLTAELTRVVKDVDQGKGVLILTDLYGSTPSNIAQNILAEHDVRIVSGMNLPMLLRIFNYPKLELDALVEKAVEGGQIGIVGS